MQIDLSNVDINQFSLAITRGTTAPSTLVVLVYNKAQEVYLLTKALTGISTQCQTSMHVSSLPFSDDVEIDAVQIADLPPVFGIGLSIE